MYSEMVKQEGLETMPFSHLCLLKEEMQLTRVLDYCACASLCESAVKMRVVNPARQRLRFEQSRLGLYSTVHGERSEACGAKEAELSDVMYQ